jgi:dTDP-4-dehydrorhamnose reductase
VKIAVIGAKGMLGTDFCDYIASKDIDLVKWDIPEMDITNVDRTIATIKREKPNIIFHFAAYTDVDGAEIEKAKAYAVNTQGTWTLALAAKEIKAKLLYMSTNFIFDGTQETDYNESDKPNPINYYGLTKLLGEKAIIQHLKKYYIVRTSWLYGKNGKNFVTTILKIAKEKENLEVVSDQIGCPTYTKDLCEHLFNIANKEHYGIFHLTNSGKCSWYQFACEIIKQAGLKNSVLPISSDKISRPAKRPFNSVLENHNYQSIFKNNLRPWNEALKDYLLELGVKQL